MSIASSTIMATVITPELEPVEDPTSEWATPDPVGDEELLWSQITVPINTEGDDPHVRAALVAVDVALSPSYRADLLGALGVTDGPDTSSDWAHVCNVMTAHVASGLPIIYITDQQKLATAALDNLLDKPAVDMSKRQAKSAHKKVKKGVKT